MAHVTELEPGTELDGTYRIVEPLGQGGMGAVYRAELVRLPKRVALKVLHVASDEAAKARFRREAEIAAQVDHPRIVDVLDYNFLQDGSPYLVMELLQGHDLRHRMEQGPIPPGEAVPILNDTASALERLHELGIVHRDLKPENIFLATEGDEVRAKILDFGISKLVDAGTALTAEHSVVGTPSYMAPEQVQGDNAHIEPRTDQFALAAVAYEMLTGQPAFRGESVMQLFHRILTDSPPTLSGAQDPTPADAVLARALSKSRDERYPSVRAFITALAEALGQEPPRVSGVDVMAQTMASDPPPAPPSESGEGGAPVAQGPAVQPQGAEGFAGAAVGSGDRPGEHGDGSPPAASSHGGPRTGPPRAGMLGIVAGALGLGAAIGAVWMMQADATSSGGDAVDANSEAAPVDPSGSVAGGAVDSGAEAKAASDGAARVGRTGKTERPSDRAARASGDSGPDESEAHAQPDSESSDEPAKPKRRTATNRRRAGAAKPSDPKALRELKAAEQSLASEQARAAIRHARRSLQNERSMAARAVMAKAQCLQQDLGMAKAMARGLRGASLRAVKRYCSKRGMDI